MQCSNTSSLVAGQHHCVIMYRRLLRLAQLLLKQLVRGNRQLTTQKPNHMQLTKKWQMHMKRCRYHQLWFQKPI